MDFIQIMNLNTDIEVITDVCVLVWQEIVDILETKTPYRTEAIISWYFLKQRELEYYLEVWIILHPHPHDYLPLRLWNAGPPKR